MITHEDQLRLFKIIGDNLTQDVTCYAFGGTAMMFYGYKDETKDIDLLFLEDAERKTFIKTIEKQRFEFASATRIYIPEKLRTLGRPVMYKNETTRFDLFLKTIFRTKLSPKMEEDLFAVHEFKGKHTLKVKVLQTEHIVFLKSITERIKDFDDIRLIVEKDTNFSWDYLTDEAIWQHKHGDTWALLDVEKTIKELREYVFIEDHYLNKLYEVRDEKK